MNVVRLRPPRGALDLLAGRLGPRVGDVLGDRGREQEAVVGDEGDRAAQRVHVDRAQVGAVDEDRALGRVIEPRDQRDEAGLPGAGRPDERDRPPGLDLELDPAQRRLGAVVASARPSRNSTCARARRAAAGRPAGWSIRGSRSRISNIRLPEATARWAIPSAIAEHPHRADQHHQVGVEDGEVAEREVAVDHLAAADQQHDGEPEAGDEAEQRRVEGAQPGRVDVLVEDPRDPVAEALEHVLLARERLHDPDPRDALLGLGRELADPLLDLLQRRAREPAEARRGRGRRTAPAAGRAPRARA